MNLAINNIGPVDAQIIAKQNDASVLGAALKSNNHLRVLKMVDVISNEQDLACLPPSSALGDGIEVVH
ncbi:hypothetical protein HMPREF1544_05927 [Mucor circinelloides 1006PhL]|uniref:Uncharacterized protein n=1 Tax=Mucor circinelloides f. circinelloides (strain 1006PhL) TaxID=1220926 RepID=S2JAW7_MUCC1|nr:hypothetical protein HMPREF1544_05927 [Mucor circinelloides 1006PhL]KAG1107531.1 hypothetical protein G6F42_016335 [Rhizopus arrhizus]